MGFAFSINGLELFKHDRFRGVLVFASKSMSVLFYLFKIVSPVEGWRVNP